MLSVAPKGGIARAVAVTLDEDRLLRAAFSRYGGDAQDRAAAAAVVARIQQLGAGHWFLCDCRPGAERPAVLVPVAQTHIRRHEDAPRWPAHSEACDFYREPQEQRLVTASYASPSTDKPMRLALPLGRAAAKPPDGRIEGVSRHVARPGLARLLIQLVTDAGLQAIGPGWRPPSLVDQVKAIWTAARPIEIDSGVRLPEFLCTSPGRLGELMAKIAASPPGRFTRNRPHGVLVVRLSSVRNGVLQPVSGEPIAVRGRPAVFGEQVGAERAARAPYLAACVVGQAEEGSPVEVLSAYVHPCAGDAHLMLVDSDMERRSLAQLRSLQDWLGGKKDVRVSIEKPLYDLLRDDTPGAPPRPPCIPDFLARVVKPGGAVVVAETMGFADAEYRSRKQRMHPLMAAAAGAVDVVPHDFHEPTDQPQSWRDDRFWRRIRWALTGPDAA